MASIAAVCEKIGRNPADITVLAASKYAEAKDTNLIIGEGIKLIGENRVQDAKQKFPLLQPVRKHFIGHLQQNKVKAAVELFDCIESVESVELAQKIDQESQKQKKHMPVYLEINIAGDSKKFGLAPEKVLGFLREISELTNIKVEGFMTIVPFFNNAEETRPYFREIKGLFDLCSHEFPTHKVLSMGMSHDYRIAIEEGANEIRIGSLLFKENTSTN